ncbi:uncharacterized protein LOC127714879 [Mytilus californianus]|uniref:uncharacterized protein LOC127714879 n=1 Tax=Mytilus californianus TaxID=6549 RepID=UPI0022484FFD|nr:uncharacterized protein LOC127714879 [Mytilus californianus]
MSLCEKYVTCLLDVHVILQEIDTKVDATSAEIRTAMDNSNAEVTKTIGTKTADVLATMAINSAVLVAKIEEMSQNNICQRCKRSITEQDKEGGPSQPYTLGQSLFTLHHQIDLPSAVGAHLSGGVIDIVMMDDGRLVMCLLVHETTDL